MKAFPWSIDNGESVRGEKGMDLRDYFAAKAMHGFIDSKIVMEACDEHGVDLPLLIATMCYDMADAMMKERDRVDDSHEIMAAAIMKKKGQG
jgi:hypothetical protein